MVTEAQSAARKRVLGPKWEGKHTPWNAIMRSCIDTMQKKSSVPGMYQINPQITTVVKLARAGRDMELSKEMMEKSTEELTLARTQMEETANQVSKVFEVLEPDLIKIVDRVRSARMSVVTEMQSALAVMKDVRKFFLEKEYQTEIARLREFIELAERLKELMNDGTLNAICDATIKLGIGESDG